MNRNCYRLVFNTTLGMMVPVDETARRSGKAGSGKATSGAALALAGALLAGSVQAELPEASANFAAPGTTANYQKASDTQAYMNQVGNKAVVNFDRFNISAGHDLRVGQVDSLAAQNLVPNAVFSSLILIHDVNPSIIAGSISQAAGQHANVTMISSNGIAFMGSAQVNVNSFTASTLNMQDKFLDNFLPGTDEAQFENALDGGVARGFIKVFEGAQITAGTQGRVMLIAPTVINKGTVKAADGQVIAAAGAKVYLRSAAGEDDNVRGLLVEVDSPIGLNNFDTPIPDDPNIDTDGVRDGFLDNQNMVLRDEAFDKLGHVTNLGELSTPRGNVTMVGYAVNQQGIARATTSVIANGSVYLLAKDTTRNTVTSDISLAKVISTRAGRVLLGETSRTEVLPETADNTGGLDGTTGAGLAKQSQVKVLGQDIRMAGGAVIDAPAAIVEFRAVDDPSNPLVLREVNKPASDTARIHIASGARINVAGLENVAVSAARNSVEVELRGDELKDSPVNREGVLKGEKVYVDINRALANADAGQPTLIARDSLESYQAKLERTVAERSTAGGTVSLLSEGETLLESGALFDLSGGSVKYTAANVKTTLLSSGGQSVDIADASAETRYDGIATRYVKDFGRWNVKKVFDLGQSYRFDPGYVEGKDAGTLNVVGMKAVVMQADIQGRTTTGALQREAGVSPEGARFKVGSDKVVLNEIHDYKLNQRVEVSSNGAILPAGFAFGDALSQAMKDTLVLNPALMGKDKVAHLQVFSNQAAEVREALRMPTSGSVAITAAGVAVKADIQAASGDITLAAVTNTLNSTSAPLDVTVADGVSLSARGGWINDLPTATGKSADAVKVDGGTITLTATGGDVALGQNTLIDVSGGARVKPDGKLKNGNGGDVTLKSSQALKLGGEIRGEALGKGGTFVVQASQIQIGGAHDADALNLDAGFFERGGFADFKLTGMNGVDIADGTVLRPTVISRELLAGYTVQPTGSDLSTFSRVLKQDDQVRQAANVSFAASSVGAIVRLGEKAKILADDKAEISFSAGSRVELLGEVKAAGGSISATVKSSQFDSTEAVWLGANGVLDVAGAARTYTDSRGLTQGKVLDGGSVTLSGTGVYVVTEVGSRIDVSGAAPVRLDVRNEAGGLGRNVGSDAGSVTIRTTEGALLDGTIAARAGSPTNRGGAFSLTLEADSEVVRGGKAAPVNQRVLSLANNVAPQEAGLAPGDAIPLALNGDSRVGMQAIEAAGFDRVALAVETNDVDEHGMIRLENGLNVGAARTMPLRELSLNAQRIETEGGNATLNADAIRLANDGVEVSPDSPALAPIGTLTVNARQIELAGKLALEGMAQAELNATEAIRLAGGIPKSRVDGQRTIDVRPVGELKTSANLLFRSRVVSPATFVQYSILAPGKTVQFAAGTGSPAQPWSAFGSLKVEARDIVQGGTIWAPLGKIELRADNALTFENGSLTSAAAEPNSVLPFGKLLNGRTWTYDLNVAETDSIELADMPEQKSILSQAAKVDMQAGARIDLSGGGDAQAYEFSVGPGGSRDILADKNTYAILPGYTGGFAPTDAQEKFDRASGEAVYLSGVPGLADGVYTLLPAHYALLPGAYAVKLDSGIKGVMPGQAYSSQDGVRIAAGYVTDSRIGAPRDANWQGVQVMTRDQVRARSEFTLTRATDFYADGRMRPQDAGLLSIATTGSGADALILDAIYNMKAGSGGRGAQVDISAMKIAVTSGSPSGIDPDAVVLDTDTLNALDADSLFIGGTRSTKGDTTTLAVGANEVTLANDAAHALQAGEVMLAAKDALTLKAGSALDAQGAAGDAGAYETDGNGAFVRAASTTATFARSGSPDRSAGTLVGEAAVMDANGTVITPASSIVAADSITLDATKKNAFKGTTRFEQKKFVNGVVKRVPVAGNLAVGATRINFGAPVGPTEGMTYSQDELDALDLKGLTLTSYSTFDLYGDVKVGKLDDAGKPLMQNLTLQGAGLVGINNADQTAQINAKNLGFSNPSNAATPIAGGAPANSNLAVTADMLTLGAGNKAIQGYDDVTITANELVGSGTGTLAVAAPVTLNVARIRGEVGADQALTSTTGALVVANHAADRTLAPVTVLGAKWALAGTSVDFNSKVELPSGSVKFTATGGDVTLGANAQVDVAGRGVQFFDVTKPSWGGTAEFVSETGNVTFADRAQRDVARKDIAQVDVSAVAGGDAGTLIVRAANGSFSVVNGGIKGDAPDADGKRGEGARALIDVKTLASFSNLNTALNQGGVGDDGIPNNGIDYDGFDGERDLRVRRGDVIIAKTDVVKAHVIKISTDGSNPDVAGDTGKLDVAGTLDASGTDAGRIELFAKNDVNVQATAQLNAVSSGALEDGGDIEIGTRDGKLKLATGSTFDVSGGVNELGELGKLGGTVLLRTARTSTNGVNIDGKLESSGLDTARSVAVEAVRTYDSTNIGTSDTDGNITLAAADLDTINTDNAAFATKHSTIKSDLGTAAAASNFHLLSGVEVRSNGDLTLGEDWNLSTARAGSVGGAGGEAGVLTLRAEGALNIDSNLSDGFSVATPCSTGNCTGNNPTPAELEPGDSWSYRLVAGADAGAADPLVVKPGNKDFTLAAGKLIRTGTGDIRIASGQHIKLVDNKAVIYTAGRDAGALGSFTAPVKSAFTQGGGDVRLAALGNIVGSPSAQLFNNWLFRQGKLSADGATYTTQPAWWVRFDQFQQGVGALGGGDVTITAGGSVENLSAHTPTQARMNSTTPDATALVTTGGGTVRVESGGDLLGGQYYADRGDVVLKAGGAVGSGQVDKNNQPIYAVLALGDGEARVSAQDDVHISALINPHLISQSSSNTSSRKVFNAAGTTSELISAFSTYGDESGVILRSLNGAVVLHDSTNISSDKGFYLRPLVDFSQSSDAGFPLFGLDLIPPNLSMIALQGDVQVEGGARVLLPSPNSTLELFAHNSVNLKQTLVMSDRDPASIPNAIRPVQERTSASTVKGPVSALQNVTNKSADPTYHSPVPAHAADLEPVRIYAVEGDVVGRSFATSTGSQLDVPKAFVVQAGRDVKNVSIEAQHVNIDNAQSRVQAGRDIVFTTGAVRTEDDHIHLGGTGSLDVVAGRDIDLGTAGGIVSRGNTVNPALSGEGADIRMAAGVGEAGVDYSGAVDRLMAKLALGATDDATLWQARWLTGDSSLTAGNALAAVQKVNALDAPAQQASVRNMLYTAMRETGRDSNKSGSPYAGDYARGYAAIELVFPSISDKNPDGSFAHYQGGINLFASRVQTQSGGNIEWLVPGGDMVVGLANTPAKLLDLKGGDRGTYDALGIVAAGEGDIKGFTRDDVLVNQSRILTVGGGDVLLWSSEGDIDAGKGKKTAVAVPPPLILVDSNGNVSQVLQGAASGSGIGALQPAGGTAGDVDLIAPKGTVNAGDAGIRAGNLNIAAAVVLGADNISVSGSSSGTPVADTSAVTAASSGATSGDGGTSAATAALSSNLADAARAAEELKQAFKPTFITAEVVGHGE